MVDFSKLYPEDGFVLHAHSGFGPAHFDLMLRCGEVLATWQMEQSPLDLAVSQTAKAKRIQDHRLVYLAYEGPVSGGRGEVARQDHGTYKLLSKGRAGWHVHISGQRMRGIYLLRRDEGDDWTLIRETAD